MSIVFENPEEGRKIFRGWQKRASEVGETDWLSVTVITGIERETPLHYRVAIGPGSKVVRTMQLDATRFFAMIFRTHDMAPASNQNLQMLETAFGQAGRVLLTPGELRGGQTTLEINRSDLELRVEIKNLAFTPAWSIGPDSPLMGATNGIDNPGIPSDATDVPFKRAMERRAAQQASPSSIAQRHP